MIFRGLLALFLLVGSSAFAASYQHSVLQVAISSGATFTGPGDIVSGATAWYGLRGYSAAVAATGTQKAINVRRQSDNATSDIVILTNGNLDVATAASFAGTDATCTGTIASTTLTCSGASSTPNANDPVSGAGIAQPSYIVSCGTFTAGAGTCTLNAAQTVSVAETITMQVALFVTEAYDQGGNADHATQATSGNQPTLIFNCLNATLPCMGFLGFASQSLSATTASLLKGSFTAVAQRTLNSGAGATIINRYTGTNTGDQVAFQSTSTNIFIYGGSSLTLTGATEGIFHSIRAVANGTSSSISSDATTVTGTDGAPSAATTTINLGFVTGVGQYLTGGITEGGFWGGIFFTTPQDTSMQANVKAYWGTP